MYIQRLVLTLASQTSSEPPIDVTLLFRGLQSVVSSQLPQLVNSFPYTLCRFGYIALYRDGISYDHQDQETAEVHAEKY